MSRKIRLTNEAIANLVSIGDYIAAGSPANALRWIDRIESRLRTIADFPVRHEIAYGASLVGRDVRHTFVGVYRILYAIEEGEGIIVLTVRHGARQPLSPEQVRELR